MKLIQSYFNIHDLNEGGREVDIDALTLEILRRVESDPNLGPVIHSAS